MLTKKEIREEVVSAFAQYKYKVEELKVGNGYYLFNLGDESVVHFRIKGCKKWLFGLWILNDEKENKTTLRLFGEHEDYIDKFKPTATVLSESVEFNNDSSNADIKENINDLVWSLIYNQVDVIKSSNTVGKLKFYYHGLNRGPIAWLIEQWWYYNYSIPFRNWLKRKGNKYVCMLICFILNIIYGKRLKASYSKLENTFHPCYIVRLDYKEGVDDDHIYEVYHHIHGNVGFDYAIRIEHVPFGEKRGICFRKKDEDDE